MGWETMKKSANAFTRRIGWFFPLSIIGYIGSYAVLMNRTMPAVDANEQIAFKSSFRFAHTHITVMNGLTLGYVMTSPMNYFYAPIDFCYHRYNKAAYDPKRLESDLKPRNWVMMR